MRIPTTLGLLIGFGQLVSAQGCAQYSGLISLLSSRSATDACSQVLTITTATVFESTTQISTFLTTSTSTLTERTTVTVLTETSVITSTTITTVPTAVATVTVPSTSIAVTVVTPPTVTTTTTRWSTAPAAKARRTAGARGRILEKRQGSSIPGYLLGFGPAARAAGCSCLTGAFAIVTPTVTSTNTIQETTSLTSSALVTFISTIEVTVTTSRTETTLQTVFDPRTSTITSVLTSSSTITLPTPLTVVTTTKYFPPQCTSIISGRRLFNSANPNRSLLYTPSNQFQVPGSGELGASICCARCFETPNCAAYYVWQTAPGVNFWCRFYIADGQLTTNIKTICPNGVPNAAAISGRSGTVPTTQNLLFPLGVGPCYFANDANIPPPE